MLHKLYTTTNFAWFVHGVKGLAVPNNKVICLARLPTKGFEWADRLEKKGWNNCAISLLCKQTQKSGAHLFSHCRFPGRLWSTVKECLGLPSIRVHEWSNDLSVDECWSCMSYKAPLNRKAMAVLTMDMLSVFKNK
jgi:hypothetical protein